MSPSSPIARLAGVALLACTLSYAQSIPKTEFAERRAKLQKDLDGVMVLFGRPQGVDEVFREFQEPNFWYFTGLEVPGAIVILTPKSETLFLPKRNERQEKYTGARIGPFDKDVKEVTGFADVLPLERFESSLHKAADNYYEIYAFTGQTTASSVASVLPLRSLRDAGGPIGRVRAKKSAAEIALIQKASDVTVQAQLAAWKRAAPGMFEYQLAATFVDTLMEAGCERVAYAPILGSGPNSTTLHYNASTRRMDRGEVLVMDAGAECHGYATDVTRTIPIGGKFTGRQKEIYEVVLGAQKVAIAALKPGARLSGGADSLTGIAKKYMDDHGGLGKYFIHGIGHHVGLDVHDLAPNGPLEAGNVVTIEPGIYIPEEGIGVRIEDTFLVTEDGNKILSGALPKEIADVERAMAKDAVVH